MNRKFDPIKGRTSEIIDYIMSSKDIPADDDVRFKINLAVEEAVENVVDYAYGDGIGWLEADTHMDDQGIFLTIALKDAGTPFNPLDNADPDLTVSAEERQIGGLGIFLCKQLMDEISYRYEDGCNILTMKKKIG